MPDSPPHSSDPTTPRYGQRPPQAGPMGGALGQGRPLQSGAIPETGPPGHGDARRPQTWTSILVAIVVIIAVLALLTWLLLR